MTSNNTNPEVQDFLKKAGNTCSSLWDVFNQLLTSLQETGFFTQGLAAAHPQTKHKVEMYLTGSAPDDFEEFMDTHFSPLPNDEPPVYHYLVTLAANTPCCGQHSNQTKYTVHPVWVEPDNKRLVVRLGGPDHYVHEIDADFLENYNADTADSYLALSYLETVVDDMCANFGWLDKRIHRIEFLYPFCSKGAGRDA